MKWSLSLLLLSAISHAWADEICAPDIEARLDKKIQLTDDVNYFVRGNSKGEVSFASSNGNRVLNTNNEKLSSVPGQIDPVVSPDGEFVATPLATLFDGRTGTYSTFEGDTTALTSVKYYVVAGKVYERDLGNTLPAKFKTADSNFPDSWNESNKTIPDLVKAKESFTTSQMAFFVRGANGNFNKVYTDLDVSENYQSIGVRYKSKNMSLYRMLFEATDKIMYRDYSVNTVTHEVRPLGTIHPACSNEVGGALPMLSKDGTEFSIYNFDTQITNVYKMEKSGKCTISESIPALVGKVDFSPDGQKLAFHIDEASDPKVPMNPEFGKPDAANKLGVFIFDRKSKQLIPIQDKSNEDSYYPVFLSNDRLAFVSATRNDGAQKFAINVVGLKDRPGIICHGCSEDKVAQQKAAFLGYLYSSRCQIGDGSFRAALAGLSRLTAKRCHDLLAHLSVQNIESTKSLLLAKSQEATPDSNNQEIVDAYASKWDPSSLSNLSKGDLESLCDRTDPSVSDSSSPSVH